jgi:hypothetical protein
VSIKGVLCVLMGMVFCILVREGCCIFEEGVHDTHV